MEAQRHVNLLLTRYLVKDNIDLTRRTALSNCHCIGLNSFIINENPKIRLFVADSNCELIGKYDPSNPVVPIHSHKYDDIFYPLVGDITHHMYRNFFDAPGLEFRAYKYPRIGNENKEIQEIGKSVLEYTGAFPSVTFLPAFKLHTISLEAKASWLVIESKLDADFQQIAYGNNVKLRDDLYKPINRPLVYLENFFQENIKL